MTQRQLRMVQAIADGIDQAGRDLNGPGARLAMEQAMDDLCSDKPAALGLAATAYYAMMYAIWREHGWPGPDPDWCRIQSNKTD